MPFISIMSFADFFLLFAYPSRDVKTDKVEEIARGNPQWPQAFYPTKKQFDLEKGDTLLVRCTYDSSERNRTTETGTQKPPQTL